MRVYVCVYIYIYIYTYIYIYIYVNDDTLLSVGYICYSCIWLNYVLLSVG